MLDLCNYSAMPQLSPIVLDHLTAVITGGSGNDPTPPTGIYRSGPKLEQFFRSANLAFRLASGSRVSSTLAFLDQTYAYGDGFNDIKRVIEHSCDPRHYLEVPDKALVVRGHMNAVLEADGLAVTIVGGKAHLVERQASGAIVEPFISKIAILSFDSVQVEIARAVTNIAADPEDTVTAACSLIEAVCRSILIELKLPLPPRKDIEGLLKAVQEPLDLSPGRTDLPPEVEQDVRQILGGLTTVAKGVGALRTHGGDAHGREKGFRRIDARIARLTLHAASTIALFLIETWERKERRALPQHGETT